MSIYSEENGRLDRSSEPDEKLDLLSDVLRFVQLKGGLVFSGGVPETGELQRLRDVSSIHVVQEGSIELVQPRRPPLSIKAGEVLLIPRGGVALNIRASSDAERPPRMISATFTFDNAGAAGPLLKLLPDFIHITPAMDKSSVLIKDVAQFLVLETANPEPGFSLMISRVIDILVIRCIRTWSRTVQNDGWVGSLADERISRAVAALHRDPTTTWTVGALASLVGMSRSSFADRFTQLVGHPPLRYLQNWRLQLGFDLLHNTPLSVKEIAYAVGYESEAAFSRAYRTKFGYPPRDSRVRTAGSA